MPGPSRRYPLCEATGLFDHWRCRRCVAAIRYSQVPGWATRGENTLLRCWPLDQSLERRYRRRISEADPEIPQKPRACRRTKPRGPAPHTPLSEWIWMSSHTARVPGRWRRGASGHRAPKIRRRNARRREAHRRRRDRASCVTWFGERHRARLRQSRLSSRRFACNVRRRWARPQALLRLPITA